MTSVGMVVETGNVTLQPEHLLAVLAGQAPGPLADRVRAVLVTAANRRFGDHAPLDDDEVLDMGFEHTFRRKEIVAYLLTGFVAALGGLE